MNHPADLLIHHKEPWLVILHASRIPPHVGLMVDGNYNSLTIKGHELDVRPEALLKTIQQRKIESIFIRLQKHPVFSNDYMLGVFQHQVQQFTVVKQGEATCLSPIKLFLSEFYALPYNEDELLYELMKRLEANDYTAERIFMHIEADSAKNTTFSLPEYSREELQEVIRRERAAYYND